jgi:hypothetical protein
MQHDDTPSTQARTLLSDGGMKVLEGSTTVLCTDGDVSINKGLYTPVKGVMVQWFQQ